ncbi:IPT/TIG domain-containing protein (plasmid) [Streptomyces sp. NBC_01362]|uniref:IPT/TIG domain-containing protein n=1 Tax=unclassified Streptomyces TaxID=2593676 RepID=UPI002958824A|nr:MULTISPECIES: IPT/TIG domain-containing protein [unclassified Streptomyces]MDV9201153.1 IPT/TIG domain-containing protein [Streptomyces sp. Wh19]
MSVFIAEVVPDSGPDSGGNTVTISGCGLADVAAVSFGDIAATSFTVDSDNAVTAVAPAGTGSVPVTVTAGTGVSDSVVYTYIGSPTAAPVVAAIAPQAGDPAGGSDIIAVGSGFTGATAVSFGDAPAAGFTVASDTIIAATTPPGAGSVPVTVTTDSGTSNPVTYTYSTSLPPALVSAAPKNARPGRTIVIFGCKVNRATTVRFGQTPATSFEVLSDNVILAVAPPGRGTVPITVTTPSGTSNHIPFTYVTAPVVAAIAPQAGDPAGGSDIIAVGSGFTGATAVSFGDAPAAGFTVASDTIIAATTPPGAGSVPVTVTTDSGTSNPVTYTYSTSLPPALVSAAPKNARPGRTIVIFGCKVNRATTVRFGQTPATSFEVLSDNVILAVAPPGRGTVPITVTTPSGTSNHIPFTYT